MWCKSISDSGLAIGIEVCKDMNECKVLFMVRVHVKSICKTIYRRLKFNTKDTGNKFQNY